MSQNYDRKEGENYTKTRNWKLGEYKDKLCSTDGRHRRNYNRDIPPIKIMEHEGIKYEVAFNGDLPLLFNDWLNLWISEDGDFFKYSASAGFIRPKVHKLLKGKLNNFTKEEISTADEYYWAIDTNHPDYVGKLSLTARPLGFTWKMITGYSPDKVMDHKYSASEDSAHNLGAETYEDNIKLGRAGRR